MVAVDDLEDPLNESDRVSVPETMQKLSLAYRKGVTLVAAAAALTTSSNCSKVDEQFANFCFREVRGANKFTTLQRRLRCCIPHD